MKLSLSKGLVVVFCTLFVSCQTSRPIPFAEADQAPSLIVPADRRSPRPPSPHVIFLEFVYGNIKYPKPAREPGVQSEFNAHYLISQNGEIKQLSVKEGAKGFADDTISIAAFRVPLIESDPGGVVPQPPFPDFTAADTLAGNQALIAEIERVIHLLPVFQPAIRKGQPVAVRKTTRFEFRLE